MRLRLGHSENKPNGRVKGSKSENHETLYENAQDPNRLNVRYRILSCCFNWYVLILVEINASVTSTKQFPMEKFSNASTNIYTSLLKIIYKLLSYTSLQIITAVNAFIFLITLIVQLHFLIGLIMAFNAHVASRRTCRTKYS